MVSPSRQKVEVECSKCHKVMLVRRDYLSKHSGVCLSCQKIGNCIAKKHGDYKSRLYKIWVGMFHRRYRVSPDVCAEWHDYEEFRKWSECNGYSDNLTIDRINPSAGYSPDNCQWITHEYNSGKDKRILVGGLGANVKSDRISLGMTQVEYAKHIGVSRNTVQRAERGEYDKW